MCSALVLAAVSTVVDSKRQDRRGVHPDVRAAFPFLLLPLLLMLLLAEHCIRARPHLDCLCLSTLQRLVELGVIKGRSI